MSNVHFIFTCKADLFHTVAFIQFCNQPRLMTITQTVVQQNISKRLKFNYGVFQSMYSFNLMTSQQKILQFAKMVPLSTYSLLLKWRNANVWIME